MTADACICAAPTAFVAISEVPTAFSAISEVPTALAATSLAVIELDTISVVPTALASSVATNANCLPMSAIMFAPDTIELHLSSLQRLIVL